MRLPKINSNNAYVFLSNAIALAASLPALDALKYAPPVIGLIYNNLEWNGILKTDITFKLKEQMQTCISEALKETLSKLSPSQNDFLNTASEVATKIFSEKTSWSMTEWEDSIRQGLFDFSKWEKEWHTSKEINEITDIFMGCFRKILADYPELSQTMLWEQLDLTQIRLSELEKQFQELVPKTDLSNKSVKYFSLFFDTRYREICGSNGPFRNIRVDSNLFSFIGKNPENPEEDKETQELYDYISGVWAEHGSQSKSTTHFFLIGDGGTGKTVHLLRTWQLLLEHNICSLYIPLHELSKGRIMLGEFLKENIFHDQKYYCQFLDFLRDFHPSMSMVETGSICRFTPAFVLLLDGYNEIRDEMRERIMGSVYEWSMKENVQLVVTSRHDFIPGFTGINCDKLYLRKLSLFRVDAFFKNQGLSRKFELCELADVLDTPLTVKLYAETNDVLEGDTALADILDWNRTITSTTDLLWNFLQCQLIKAFHLTPENKNILTDVIAIRYILPYIGWVMESTDSYVIQEENLYDLSEQAVKYFKKAWHESLPRFLKNIKMSYPAGRINWDIGGIVRLLTQKYHLLIKSQNEFSLMHQHFRDFLSALHILNVIDEKTLAASDVLARRLPQPVMESIIVLGGEKFVCWMNLLRGKRLDDLDYTLYNIMEILKGASIRRCGVADLSDMDFSHLDLRKVVLEGCFFSTRKRSASFQGAMLSESSFLLQCHKAPIQMARFSKDQKSYYTLSADHVLIAWEVSTGRLLAEAKLEIPETSLLESSINQPGLQKQLLPQAVPLEDVRELLPVVIRDSIGKTWAIYPSNGALTYKTENRKYHTAIIRNGRLYIYDTESGQVINDISTVLNSCYITGSIMSISGNGTLLAVGLDTSMNIIDWNSGKTEHSITLPPDDPYLLWYGAFDSFLCGDISPDGSFLAGGTAKGRIILWDLNAGSITEEASSWEILSEKWPYKSQGSVVKIRYSPDQRFLAAGYGNGRISLYELPFPGTCYDLYGHTKEVTDLSFSNDGRYLLSVSDDRSAILWNVKKKTKERCHEDHTTRCTAASFIDDGIAVSALNNGDIYIWDIEKGCCIQKFSLPEKEKMVLRIFSLMGGKSFCCIATNNLSNYINQELTFYQYETKTGCLENQKVLTTKAWRSQYSYLTVFMDRIDLKTYMTDFENSAETAQIFERALNLRSSIKELPDDEYISKCFLQFGKERLKKDKVLIAFSVSPNEKNILTAALDGDLILWDASSQKRIFCLHRINEVNCHQCNFSGAEISSDYLKSMIREWADEDDDLKTTSHPKVAPEF